MVDLGLSRLNIKLPSSTAHLADWLSRYNPISGSCRKSSHFGARIMNSRGIRLVTAPASFGFIAAFVMWIVTAAYFGFGNVGAILSAALAFGAVSGFVGTGQMLVIASGPGKNDL